MHNKKSILLGDYTHPKFHPLQGVDAQISHILNEEISVQCSENKNLLRLEHLKPFDLCICYFDLWDDQVSKHQTSGLLSYVSQGGGLLVLHNGLSLGNRRYELAQLVGGRFDGHPPIQTLSFRVNGEDAITAGVEPFELDEEPYQIQFDPFTEKEVLLEYKLNDTWYPAAWKHEYGLGRVVYFMPGHNDPTFRHPQIRKLILQAARWAAHLPG
ncbi:ThuA domain-containing protein [Paenibacillus sp.]|uniref:ThuA domain-containing protein n=1 Tax=Paenibacillus sp. TaxID=58172 RepID=UPI0028254203|nr:ThuA domain-containing protein [Paenibacillus sp.]MDR0267104.1 ThuA domain-containing protein [Paenibacillus sp.]